jgi:flagellin
MQPLNPNKRPGPELLHLQQARKKTETHAERLASGKKINSAKDDAAGMAVAQLLRADVASLRQRVRNANDGVSMLQTADGAMGGVQDSLVRMKELATQASSDVLSDEQKQIIADEFDSLAEGIDNVVENTTFNGHALLDGESAGPSIDTAAGGLSVDGRTDLTAVKGLSFTNATDAMHAVDAAMDKVTSVRAEVGSTVNRLETAVDTLQVQAENSLAAQSRIEDADMAREAAAHTANLITQQAGVAMASQSMALQTNMLALLQ